MVMNGQMNHKNHELTLLYLLISTFHTSFESTALVSNYAQSTAFFLGFHIDAPLIDNHPLNRIASLVDHNSFLYKDE